MPDDVQPPRSAPSWRWPAIVIGLLITHVALMAGVAVFASRDRSFTVIPDYYQKAQNWDRDQAKLRASTQLGWRVTLVPATSVDPLGKRQVTVILNKSDGSPVADATIELTWFHNTRANEVQRASFRTDAQGKAQSVVIMRYAGEYNIHVQAIAEGHEFVSSFPLSVVNLKEGGR